MWSTVGLLVALLIAFDATDAFDRSKAKDVITDFRVRSQNLHIDSVEEQLKSLEDEFDQLSNPPEQAEIARAKARIRKLEGSYCPEKEVSCRGEWPECVHHLLVCDGHKDCHNGNDEDERLCDASLVRVGSSFRGVVHWHSCVVSEDHYWTFTITATKRSPFFTNRTFLRATITREFEDHTASTYTAKGYYVFAARKLVLTADEGTHADVVTICTFNFGDSDQAECKIVLESSLSECGLVRVERA